VTLYLGRGPIKTATLIAWVWPATLSIYKRDNRTSNPRQFRVTYVLANMSLFRLVGRRSLRDCSGECPRSQRASKLKARVFLRSFASVGWQASSFCLILRAIHDLLSLLVPQVTFSKAQAPNLKIPLWKCIRYMPQQLKRTTFSTGLEFSSLLRLL